MLLLKPGTLSVILLSITALLVVCNVVLGLLQYFSYPERGFVRSFLQLFDLDEEGNIATWYAVFLLNLATLLLVGISRLKHAAAEPFSRHWIGLSVIFALLSLDEALALHERAIVPLRDLLGTGGLFYFAWTVPATLLAILFALSYRGFLRHLPHPARRLIAVAGLTYVGGALGMEMVGGYLLDEYGAGVRTGISVILEESLELAGVIVFLQGLLVYVGHWRRSVTLTVAG